MPQSYQCFCGENFQDKEALIRHNVGEHDMSEQESRRKVMEKYPE